MDAGPPHRRLRARRARPVVVASAGLAVLALLAAAAVGLDVIPGQSATAGLSPTPDTAVQATASLPMQAPSVAPPTATVPSRRSLDADEQAFADAYLALAEAHDRAVQDILIANPLSEYDLVGARLIDRLEQTRVELGRLPAVALTADRMQRLDLEMAATVALLRGVDPHGSRVEQATRYMAALDYWIEHVASMTDEIRRAVGLPRPDGGDLGL